ncbi:Flp pilus assembly protein CpaB [Stenotrophomonas sp. SY1]|uniref:Flp pilus assembly protein CpaB n=1 Tax=Stenotrophomonas sp. SY1 TaxID=477235 RepID=UPI001E4C17E3|nr:Flp pilus assembly protein CpaB [Stenotrophomonas sp. SY1]MCD9087412.1 Flp pilus assembly protein CpaB [Stenotrophomonas sp. SY1]
MPKAIRIAAILLLVLAGILAVLAVGIARRSAPAADAPVAAATTAKVPARVVVVATRALIAGQPIAAADLSTTELPVAPNEGFASIDEVAGRVPGRDIAAGAMLAPSQLLQGIAATVKPGERAVSVPVDELAGVSNRVTPGDYVDVFVSLQSPTDDSNQNANPQARLLLSRLRVLGYGADDVGRQQAASTEGSTGQPEPGSRAETIASRNASGSSSDQANAPARSAILAVPVEDAGQLLLAAHNGRLFLALRNPGDTALADASLFAAPAPVLALRGNLDAADADAASRPENQAFAGISLAALAGDDTRKPTAVPAQAQAPRARGNRPVNRNNIEIIRGTTPSNRLSSP